MRHKTMICMVAFLGLLATEAFAGPYSSQCGVSGAYVVVIASLPSGAPHPTCNFACTVRYSNGSTASTPICRTQINDGSTNSRVCQWLFNVPVTPYPEPSVAQCC